MMPSSSRVESRFSLAWARLKPVTASNTSRCKPSRLGLWISANTCALAIFMPMATSTWLIKPAWAALTMYSFCGGRVTRAGARANGMLEMASGLSVRMPICCSCSALILTKSSNACAEMLFKTLANNNIYKNFVGWDFIMARLRRPDCKRRCPAVPKWPVPSHRGWRPGSWPGFLNSR